MTKNKVVSNLIWRFMERSGAQGVSFIVSLVLARLLTPNDYGVVAIMMVFINVLQVFVDSGFGNALIQKREADNLDFSTVFYFNLLICVVLYVIMYFTAPLIALFYKNSDLVAYIRVLSIVVIISGLKNVQQAYVSRTMQFKKFFFATLGGTIVAAITGISLAYLGFGVWSLIAQQIINTFIDTIVLFITVNWKPQIKFSLDRLKTLFSFGWKLLIAKLIDTIYLNLRSLIIGKMYSSASLAFYNQGEKIPNLLITNIDNSIDSVLLPAMASEQDNMNRVKEMTRKSIQLSSYIVAPMMMGVAFMSENLVRLVLTDKWLPCVFFLRIFCITYMFYPIHNANLTAINALGRSDLFLKLEIQKKIIGLICLISTMWFGVKAMACSLLVISVVCQIINARPNKKLLGYGYVEQLRDILPNIGTAIFMGLCIYCVNYLHINILLMVLIQIILGMVIYFICSYIFKLDAFVYLYKFITSGRGKNE